MGQNQVKEEKESAETAPILLDEVTQKQAASEPPFPLHRAAYLGECDKVRDLLTTNIPGAEPLTRRQNNAKMTPLHHAACGAAGKCIEICSLLIEKDLEDSATAEKDLLVNLQDSKGKTPLHYAAACRHPALIQFLLSKDANPNIKDVDGASPLHICAEGKSEAAIESARILLSAPSIIPYEPCGPNRSSRNVMHIAAHSMSSKMLDFFLKKGFDHSKKDSRGLTPLMLAASSGDSDEAVKCVEILLKISTAEEINAKSDDSHQTALMMAAFRSHQKVLKILLEDKKTDALLLDSQKRTAMHWAVEAWFRTNSLACVKLLAQIDQISEWDKKLLYLYGSKDIKGDSPIEIAIKHHCIRITEYLITAHPTPEAWLNEDMLNKIYSKLPEAMVPLMDQSLRYNPAKFHERNESIQVEFGTITGFSDPVDENRQETKFLHHIMRAPKEIQRTMFLHPLVQLFLDLKWKHIKYLTWFSIAFQMIWLLVYSILILEIYVPNCPHESNDTNAHPSTNSDKVDGNKVKTKKLLKASLSLTFQPDGLSDCDFNHNSAQLLSAILYILSIILIVKEIFQMRHYSKYFWNPTNYAQILVLIVSFINTAPAWQSTSEVAKWLTYLAAFGIFTAWVLSLREVGKLPQCGIYAAILKKVFWHCLKMLVFYCPLLFAFSMCLRLLVPGKGQYMYLFFAIVKVVIMMTGELDFEDAFYEEDGPSLALSAIFGQFVFLLLVFITTIVLLNLLTGLAVNDVQSLIEEAEINRLSNELEQIYSLESLIVWCRHKIIGLERWTDLFYKLNVTTTIYPDYACFTSLKSEVETKGYPQDLKVRIRNKMVAVEED